MYYTKKNTLDPKWVDEEALQNARRFYSPDDKQGSIKSSQLRKFYAEFKSLERQLTYEAFENILPLIRIVKAKVAYACGRKVVPPTFRDWMHKHINAIKEERDFKAFLLHFEAVVGFVYGEGLKD